MRFGRGVDLLAWFDRVRWLASRDPALCRVGAGKLVTSAIVTLAANGGGEGRSPGRSRVGRRLLRGAVQHRRESPKVGPPHSLGATFVNRLSVRPANHFSPLSLGFRSLHGDTL